MVPGRSAKVLTEWLNARDQAFRDRVKVVTMDGFAGYHSAAAKAVPAARTVMDPFHVVHLAADKLTKEGKLYWHGLSFIDSSGRTARRGLGAQLSTFKPEMRTTGSKSTA